MSEETGQMIQVAPYPTALADLVGRWRYRPGWRFRLVADADRDRGGDRVVGHGMTLIITTFGHDSRHHDVADYRVNHFMIVPAATYDERSWRRWLFEQCLLVERHEACEFASVEHDDGTVEFPWAPSHGPGNDPYMIRELGTVADQRTRFTGEVLDH